MKNTELLLSEEANKAVGELGVNLHLVRHNLAAMAFATGRPVPSYALLRTIKTRGPEGISMTRRALQRNKPFEAIGDDPYGIRVRKPIAISSLDEVVEARVTDFGSVEEITRGLWFGFRGDALAIHGRRQGALALGAGISALGGLLGAAASVDLGKPAIGAFTAGLTLAGEALIMLTARTASAQVKEENSRYLPFASSMPPVKIMPKD